MQATKTGTEQLVTYWRRVELLVGARFRESTMISSAIRVQDRLRKKIGHWKGSEEIRKWRMTRS